MKVNVGCVICQRCWHTPPQEDISHHPVYLSSTEKRSTKLCQQNNEEPQLQGTFLPLQQSRFRHLRNAPLMFSSNGRSKLRPLTSVWKQIWWWTDIPSRYPPPAEANKVERYQVSARTPPVLYETHISETIAKLAWVSLSFVYTTTLIRKTRRRNRERHHKVFKKSTSVFWTLVASYDNLRPTRQVDRICMHRCRCTHTHTHL